MTLHAARRTISVFRFDKSCENASSCIRYYCNKQKKNRRSQDNDAMIPTLNLTSEDVERGSYESSKKIILENFVKKKAVRNDYGKTPSTVFKSKLLELMLADCAKSGVVVVKAPGGHGKSIAAKAILQNSPGGIMFRNCQDDITSYSQGMAEALGIPKSVYRRTSKWRNILIEAVASIEKKVVDIHSGENADKKQSSWWDNMVDKVTSLCAPDHSVTATGSLEGPEEPLQIDVDDESLRKLKKRKKGILILDDFNDVKDKDIDFMRSFFPVAHGADILVFVLVRDTTTADKLLKVNGWYRLFPLRGLCLDSQDLPTGVDGKEPKWSTPMWTAEMLIKLVRANVRGITDAQLSKLAIGDGEEPNDLLVRAGELIQEDE